MRTRTFTGMVVCMIFMLAASTGFMTPANAAEQVVSGGIQVHVSSKAGWQTMPFYVKKGQQVSIMADGDWSVGTSWTVGPEGYSKAEDANIYQGCKLDYSYTYATLLGKVGNGRLFAVRSGIIFTADRDGYVKLRIHDADWCLVDNFGDVTALLYRAG